MRELTYRDEHGSLLTRRKPVSRKEAAGFDVTVHNGRRLTKAEIAAKLKKEQDRLEAEKVYRDKLQEIHNREEAIKAEKRMTVGQLIEALSKHDPSLPVRMYENSDYDDGTIYGTELSEHSDGAREVNLLGWEYAADRLARPHREF